MLLAYINVINFRNLNEYQLEFDNKCNVFYGKNGSGKTSLLEAIYYLILGRSFRSHILRRIIKYGNTSFSLFGKIYNDGNLLPVGITKSITVNKKIKIAGQEISSSLEITKIAPLQLLNHSGYFLFYHGPKARRQFMDWGLFHVEQSFLNIWRVTKRILEHRNTAIRLKSTSNYITIWNKKLSQVSFEIHLHRMQYIRKFIPVAQNILKKILQNCDISISYVPGWNTRLELEAILIDNFKSDIKYGYTTAGPHRADLDISIGKIPVKDVLSRGQQKLLFCGLQIAQGILLHQLTEKRCIYLIDDLLADLDLQKCQLLIDLLFSLQGAQIFITELTYDNVKRALINNINNCKTFCLD
jgi:DNA replication and repair protein RecF